MSCAIDAKDENKIAGTVSWHFSTTFYIFIDLSEPCGNGMHHIL
jgi:hypothetical protein